MTAAASLQGTHAVPAASPARAESREVLLFDLDGTLIDSQVGITACVAHALHGMGHPGLPQEQLLGWIGPALRVSFAAELDGDPARIEQAVTLYRERFETLGWREHTVYPGIDTLLSTLHARGQRMAVVTAKNEPHARRIIEHLPFAHVFADVIGATADGRLSHKPELIAEALSRLGLSATQCTMIGDRHMDMDGARHHAMPGIGVLWGFGSAGELAAAGAVDLVASPAELLEMLSP